MLASMSSELWEEWKQFYELDPALDEKMEWGLAHIVQAVIRDGKKLSEFMLPLGDRPGPVRQRQTIAFQEMLINAWCDASNVILGHKQGVIASA